MKCEKYLQQYALQLGFHSSTSNYFLMDYSVWLSIVYIFSWFLIQLVWRCRYTGGSTSHYKYSTPHKRAGGGATVGLDQYSSGRPMVPPLLPPGSLGGLGAPLLGGGSAPEPPPVIPVIVSSPTSSSSPSPPSSVVTTAAQVSGRHDDFDASKKRDLSSKENGDVRSSTQVVQNDDDELDQITVTWTVALQQKFWWTWLSKIYVKNTFLFRFQIV